MTESKKFWVKRIYGIILVNMEKYIIKVNDKEYHSYKEMCVDLDIDFEEFMKIKHANPGMSQLDLLSSFYEKALIRMTDSSFFVNKRNKHIRPISAHS